MEVSNHPTPAAHTHEAKNNDGDDDNDVRYCDVCEHYRPEAVQLWACTQCGQQRICAHCVPGMAARIARVNTQLRAHRPSLKAYERECAWIPFELHFTNGHLASVECNAVYECSSCM